jgi:hypothetical protein
MARAISLSSNVPFMGLEKERGGNADRHTTTNNNPFTGKGKRQNDRQGKARQNKTWQDLG